MRLTLTKQYGTIFTRLEQGGAKIDRKKVGNVSNLQMVLGSKGLYTLNTNFSLLMTLLQTQASDEVDNWYANAKDVTAVGFEQWMQKLLPQTSRTSLGAYANQLWRRVIQIQGQPHNFGNLAAADSMFATVSDGDSMFAAVSDGDDDSGAVKTNCTLDFMEHVPAGVNEYLESGGLEMVCFDFDSQPFESVRTLFIWANDADKNTQKQYDGLPPHGTGGLDKKSWEARPNKNKYITENGKKRFRKTNEKTYFGVNNNMI